MLKQRQMDTRCKLNEMFHLEVEKSHINLCLMQRIYTVECLSTVAPKWMQACDVGTVMHF
jgi:hypothetical protein